jgi:pectate lyase
MSWAIEETTHFSSNDSTTVQWCIISESLYNSIHKKGERGYGTQWGGEYASYHHNLLAHHVSRMPRINGSNKNDMEALVDYRNNFNFNWGSTDAFYGGEWENTGGAGFCRTNVVNNYFKPGPATPGTKLFARPSLNRSGVPLDGYGKWFFSGNFMEGVPTLTADNWLGVDGSAVGGIANIRSDQEFVRTDGVFENHSHYTETAGEACESVLKYAGATLPLRDAIDKRLVAEIRGEIPVVRYSYTTGDGQMTPVKGVSSGIIDTQRNLVPADAPAGTTPWDLYHFSADADIDSDGDGIPDFWEISNGLDQTNIADGRLIAQNGYSNLENYLNSMGVVTACERAAKNEHLRMWPVPSNGELFLECFSPVTRVTICDRLGRKVLSSVNPLGIRKISLGNLPSGLYLMLAVSAENRIYTGKILKE